LLRFRVCVRCPLRVDPLSLGTKRKHMSDKKPAQKPVGEGMLRLLTREEAKAVSGGNKGSPPPKPPGGNPGGH